MARAVSSAIRTVGTITAAIAWVIVFAVIVCAALPVRTLPEIPRGAWFRDTTIAAANERAFGRRYTQVIAVVRFDDGSEPCVMLGTGDYVLLSVFTRDYVHTRDPFAARVIEFSTAEKGDGL